MKVSFDIPDRDWWRFSGIAEKRGMTLSELLSDAIRAEIRRPYIEVADEQQAQRQALVEYLVDQGFTDTRIAERLGVPVHFVRTARTHVGLPANKQRRSEERTAA